MVPYFITIILMVVFAAAAQTTRRVDTSNRLSESKPASKVTCALLILAVIPLVFTAGFRYYIGTDFGAYYKANEVFGDEVWERLKTLTEPGIPLIIKIVNIFTKDNGAYIFAFAFFTIVPTAYVFLRRSNDYTKVLLLYVFCGCWHGSFNGVRQYLAATVIIFGHRYILDKKLLKYALCVFVAFLFHRSAIIMIVPYFVMRGKINVRNILLLALGTLIVSANYETIFSIIGDAKGHDISISIYSNTAVNVLRVLANCAPAILAVIMYIKKKPNPEQTFYINGLIMNAAAMIAASNSTYLARVSVYTGLFIPIGLSKLIHFDNKRIERMAWFAIIVLFAIFWYYEVSTHPALNDFRWVWERDLIKGVS